MVTILKSKREQRAAYWGEIKKRVTTHEGEILHGSKGQHYQEKYGKQYLGRELKGGFKVDPRQVEQHEKTKK